MQVDAYGLPLDGYDYGSKMSVIGGGTFVSASGRVGAIAAVAATREAAARLDLPEASCSGVLTL
jgi:hypothetical protein